MKVTLTFNTDDEALSQDLRDAWINDDPVIIAVRGYETTVFPTLVKDNG